MALDLGKIEIGGAALGDDRFRVVEDIEPEIDERPRHLLPVDRQVALGQVPAARSHQEYSRRLGQSIGLTCDLVLEVNLAGPAILEIDLTLDDVGKARRGGVLEIAHEYLGA